MRRQHQDWTDGEEYDVQRDHQEAHEAQAVFQVSPKRLEAGHVHLCQGNSRQLS